MWQKNGQKRSYNSYTRVTFISEHSLYVNSNGDFTIGTDFSCGGQVLSKCQTYQGTVYPH